MVGDKRVAFILLLILCSLVVALPNVETVSAAEDSWATMTPMPTERGLFGVAVVEGKMYAIGGAGPSGYLNTTEEYDPATDTWTTKASKPTTHSGFGIAVWQNKIYCIGGEINEVYDPATDTWSLGEPIPNSATEKATGATTGVLAPKRIYVIGGETKTNQIYDPETDTWTYGTDMPTPRKSLAVAVINDRIYALGGFLGWGPVFTYYTVNERYTPADFIPEFPSWAILPLLLMATLAAIICKRKLAKTLNQQ